MNNSERFSIQRMIDQSIQEAFESHNVSHTIKTARWDYEGSRTVSKTSYSNKPHISDAGGGGGTIHYSYEEKDFRCSNCGAIYHSKTDFCPDCGFLMDNGPHYGDIKNESK